MRSELLSLHRRLGVTTIYVTHDQTEAMTLGDRVVVLDKGVVQQVDAPASLYRRPRNTFVASFIGSPGMNFEDIRLVENDADDGLDAEVVITEQLGPEVLVYVRVDGLRVASGVPDTAVDRDEAVELRGTLVARLPGDTRVRAGQRARFTLNSAGVNLFDPGSGESLFTR